VFDGEVLSTRRLGDRGFSLRLREIDEYIIIVYYRCMKKRTNINLEDEDQAAIALIRRKYGATSDTAAIRFALRKILREEGQPYVPGEAGTHRQDRPTR
jgi:hypothetical protein